MITFHLQTDLKHYSLVLWHSSLELGATHPVIQMKHTVYTCVPWEPAAQLPALIPKIRTLCMFGSLATTSTVTAMVLRKSIGR